MKTDRLIDILSTNLEPAGRGGLWRALAFAIALGWVAAFCLMLATIGLRPDLAGGAKLSFLAIKLFFVLSVIGAGAAFLIRSMVPGQDEQKPFVFIFVPFAAVSAAAFAVLVIGRSSVVSHMILGTQWASCVLCIPLFSIVPFAALIWALRKGAPTKLRRTGAVAGVVAASLGAAAYAFHCPDDSLPFIAIWYGAPIALWAFIGAKLGPRLLRW
jgi:hypothetical protein